MSEPARPAADDRPSVAPRTPLGRPLHVSRLAWYGGSGLVFLAIAVMVTLSTWQYSRAKPHTDAATLTAARAQPAVPARYLLGGHREVTEATVGRKISIVGHYLPGRQWLVKRGHNGRAGFLVVSAFNPTGPSAHALPRSMLVVRGWTPTTHPPAAPAASQRLVAWIAPPESVSQTLTDSLPAGRLPEIAPARLAGQLPVPLLDGYLGLVHPTAPLQAAVEPNPAPNSGWSLLNLGYSLQWLLFAAGALIMWMLQVRDARRGADDDGAERTDNVPQPSSAGEQRQLAGQARADQAAGAGTS